MARVIFPGKYTNSVKQRPRLDIEGKIDKDTRPDPGNLIADAPPPVKRGPEKGASIYDARKNFGFSPPPLTHTEISWFCSFCLLFGEPPPPSSADVIYGSPKRIGKINFVSTVLSPQQLSRRRSNIKQSSWLRSPSLSSGKLAVWPTAPHNSASALCLWWTGCKDGRTDSDARGQLVKHRFESCPRSPFYAGVIPLLRCMLWLNETIFQSF